MSDERRRWERHYSDPSKFGELFSDYRALKEKRDAGTLTGSDRTHLRVCQEMIEGKLG